MDLFKSNVELGVEENVDEKYVEKCVSHLNNLNNSVIDEMGLLKDYFNDYDFVVKKLKDFTIEK